MSQHTPGPWEAVAFTEHTGEQAMRIVDVDGNGIPRGEGPIGETYSRTLGIPDETAKANARLIAAAPEMLEALEEIVNNAVVNYEGSMDIYSEAVDSARAAIARAKGGQ